MFTKVEFPRKTGFAKTIRVEYRDLLSFLTSDLQVDIDENNDEDNINDNSFDPEYGHANDKILKKINKINPCSGDFTETSMFPTIVEYINNSLTDDSEKTIAHGDFVKVVGSHCVNWITGVIEFDLDYPETGVINISKMGDEINDYDGNLPQVCKVIERGVPLDYWVNGDREYLCWLNMDLFRGQCLEHITQLGSTIFLITHFEYDGITYHIAHPSLDRDRFIENLNREGVTHYFRYYYECTEDNNEENYIELENEARFNRDQILFTDPNPL